MRLRTPASPCPCGGAAFATCCGRWNDAHPAPDAAALMRSRYSAYVRRDAGWLLETWHASTRPATLDLHAAPAPTWLGLELKAQHPRGDRAEVEFVARYRVGGGRAARLHETSRFVREAGRWYYVDGVVHSS